MSRKNYASILPVMLIFFVTSLSSRSVQAAVPPVLLRTNTAMVDTAVQWTDSSNFFSVTRTWNPNTHSYKNNTISNTKTLRISCTGDFTSSVLVTLTFLFNKEYNLKTLFVQPEGVLSYNISENQMTFSIDKEDDYDISLQLTGDGIDELDAGGKSIGQILVTTETEQPVKKHVTVPAQEEEETEAKEESQEESQEEAKRAIENTEEIPKESTDNPIRDGESQDNQELAKEKQQETEMITSLPDTVNGQYYETNILDGENEAGMCEIVEGALPKGMALKSDGVIAGIPEDTEGIYRIDVAVGDSGNERIEYTMKLSTLEKDVPWVDKMPDSVAGAEYTADLLTDSIPTTWSMVGGTLPEGFVLSPDGTLTGIPEKTGEFSFDILETNGIVADQIVTQTIIVYENDKMAEGDGGTLPNGVLGKPYEYLFQPTMKSRINWMVEDVAALPRGLMLTEGKIAGVPEEAGIYSINIIAEIAENYKINKVIELIVEEKQEEVEMESVEDPLEESLEETQTESINGEISEM